MAPLRISPNSPAVDPAALLASGMGVVVHGATAGTARPTEWKQIIWIGSVEPTNASADDIWYDTTTVLTPNVLMTAGMGVAVHGSASAMARPTGFKQVFWIGSIEPVNIQADDVWDDTTGDLSVGVIPVVTALPAGPYDGMEVDFVADAANFVIWRFRFRAATGKWHFVGGPALSTETTATYGPQVSGTFTNITGSSLIAPLAGEYDVEFSNRMYNTAISNPAQTTTRLGNGAAQYGTMILDMYEASTNAEQKTMSAKTKCSLGAGSLLALQLAHQGGGANGSYCYNRSIHMTPIWVTG